MLVGVDESWGGYRFESEGDGDDLADTQQDKETLSGVESCNSSFFDFTVEGELREFDNPNPNR